VVVTEYVQTSRERQQFAELAAAAELTGHLDSESQLELLHVRTVVVEMAV
jgi:hypothetical protein